MKHLKKIVAVMAAAALALTLCCVSAFAADSYTITINSKTSGHTYSAYQVFAGDLETKDGTKILSNITWGSGVDGTALLTALQADATIGSTFADCTDAASVAEKLSDMDAANTDAFAKVVAANLADTATATSATPTGSEGSYTYTINPTNPGYYFVNDAIAEGSETGNAVSKYMLQVVGPVTVAAKTDAPSVTKKVKENNDSTYKDSWNDAADFSIGQDIPFRLVGLVPDMSNYDTYTYQFNDTMSDGLTYVDGSVKVYAVAGGSMSAVNANKTAWEANTELTSGYTVTQSGQTLTIKFDNLKAVSGVTAGKYIVVEYTAKLNSNAVIGNPGNPNEVTLTYSNNPNGEGTGTTNKDEVVVFTFELPVKKTDKDTNLPLTGAKFALFADKSAAETAATDPTAENAFAKALKFTGSAGDYKLDSTVTTYELESNTDGKYSVNGLDQGTYYLVEISAPAGYNRLQTAQRVAITPDYSKTEYEDGHVPDATKDQLTGVRVKLGDDTTGGADITIANQSGATLPSTGGMGTTLFTVLGLVLMAGAAIVLIARRKASR